MIFLWVIFRISNYSASEMNGGSNHGRSNSYRKIEQTLWETASGGHSNRTLKDLLVLPISRIHLVLSKFMLVFSWCLVLSVEVCILGLAVGKIITLPGWSSDNYTRD